MFFGLVIKLPFLFRLRQRKFRKLSEYYFWKGVVSNLTEYATFRTSGYRLPFLTPTYFSLFGLFNVQRYEKGRQPSEAELREMRARWSPEAQRNAERVDSHHLQVTNFIVNNRGWHVIDYGDHVNSWGMSFSCFLIEHAEELAKCFSSGRA
ncbi:MAG TPA: hypothetical protein VJI33_00430 [Candidatus Paceibacterota bacterium]